MKKMSTIILIVFSNLVFGQNAISFVDTNAVWNVAKTYPRGNIQNPNFVATETKTYGFKGDTLINGVSWAKIFFTPDTNFSATLNLTKAGYLSSENDLVIYMDTSYNIDTIYNFNLQTGDSVNYNFSGDGNYLFIVSMDSIMIDGSYHKRFFFSDPTGPNVFTILKEIWIEGVGSIHGPLFPAEPTVFSTEYPDSLFLTCYKINDSIIWSNSNYNNCYINMVLSLNDFQETPGDIFVFPNPFTTFTRINFHLPDGSNEGEIIFYNFQGRKIRRFKVDKTFDHLLLSTADLPAGIYFFQLQTSMQNSTVKKMMAIK